MRHIKTPLIAALALAYGLVIGFEAALNSRIAIPAGVAPDTVRAAIFVGGAIVGLILMFGLKIIYESAKIAFRGALRLIGR